MIATPTVLILGAGASCPYSYPSGEALVKILVREMRGGGKYRSPLVQLGNTKEHIEEFRCALYRSARYSIDVFLEHNPRFMSVGKAAIALAIASCEDEGGLYGIEDGDWYRYLFGSLARSFADFKRHALSIVTFNYDRSLEHYLHTALRNSFESPSDEEVNSAMCGFNVIHVHGKVGNLPWEGKSNSRPYGSPKIKSVDSAIDLSGIAESAEQIRIIHEGRNLRGRDMTSSQARDLLGDAKRVAYIGFGFHRENMDLLGNYWEGQLQEQTASCFGVAPQDLTRMRNANPKVNFANSKDDALTFVRNSSFLLG